MSDLGEAFAEGYQRGRADGMAQAITLMRLAVEAYPACLALEKAARAILPDEEGKMVANMIYVFGQSVYKQGERDERARARKKAETT